MTIGLGRKATKQTNKQNEIKPAVNQWHSQNAEKVTHIKGRLLYQAMILYNYVPFQNENFSYRKEFALRGSEFFPIRADP